jgi:hypothetical protein
MDTIEELEKRRGKPPYWLLIKQEIIKNKAPEFTNEEGKTSFSWGTRSALYYRN